MTGPGFPPPPPIHAHRLKICIESNQKEKFAKKSKKESQQVVIATIPFLPVVPKPKDYPLPWYGENRQLATGRQLLVRGPKDSRNKNMYLAGSQTCVVNEEKVEDGGCGYIPHNSMCLLEIKQQPSIKQVVSHLKVLITTFNSYQGDSRDKLVKWTDRACSHIYGFLEIEISLCKTSSPKPTSEPFSLSAAPSAFGSYPHGQGIYGTAKAISGTVAAASSGQMKSTRTQSSTEGDPDPVIVDLQGLKEMPCVWTGREFIRPQVVALESKVNGPYLFLAPSTLSSKKNLARAMGIKKTFTLEEIIRAMSKMKEDFGTSPVDETCQKFLRNIVSELYDLDTSTGLEIALPDIDFVMHWSKELAFNDAAWLPPGEGHTYVNGIIPRPVAERLGVRLVRSQRLEKYVSQAKTHFGQGYPFGQREDLTQRVQNILREYTLDETVLKELLQNADDAQAEKMYIILDKRTHGKEKILSDKWQDLQGPALLVWNDKCFSERDLEGIQKLGMGSKRLDSETIGQYGIGFNVVYHLTDCPSFISGGETLCIMDPHCRYVPEADKLDPGRRFDLDAQFWADFPDMQTAYLQNDLKGCPPELRGGSLFRFPLRYNEKLVNNSEIVERRYTESSVISAERMERLLRHWAPKIKQALLFLNNVTELKFFVIDDDAMVTRSCFEVCLDEVARKQREHLHEKVDQFREPRGSEPYLVRYKLKIREERPMSIPAIVSTSEPTKTALSEEMWLIQQGIGDLENRDQNWTYIKQVKPRHGLAAPLSLPTDRQKVFSGTVFCFLPLPIRSKLPVQVNGHFILNDSRQGLWAKTDDQRGQWNRCLFNAISTSYAKLLEHAKDYYVQPSSYLDQKQLNDAIRRYYNVFPNWSPSDQPVATTSYRHGLTQGYGYVPTRPVAEDVWLELAKAVYLKLGKNNSPILASIHSRELIDVAETSDPVSPQEPRETQGLVQSHAKPKVEYTVRWHVLLSAIPTTQVHFWETPYVESRCNVKELQPILERIGMFIACAPLRIRNHFEKVDVKVPTTLPETVFKYYVNFHQEVISTTPCCIRHTKFQSVDHFKQFTLYVLQIIQDQFLVYGALPPCNS